MYVVHMLDATIPNNGHCKRRFTSYKFMQQSHRLTGEEATVSCIVFNLCVVIGLHFK